MSARRYTYCIITTAPNVLLAPIHDKMLVVLEKADWPVWLGEQPGDPALLLRPPPPDVLQCRPAREREARLQRLFCSQQVETPD